MWYMKSLKFLCNKCSIWLSSYYYFLFPFLSDWRITINKESLWINCPGPATLVLHDTANYGRSVCKSTFFMHYTVLVVSGLLVNSLEMYCCVITLCHSLFMIHFCYHNISILPLNDGPIPTMFYIATTPTSEWDCQ